MSCTIFVFKLQNVETTFLVNCLHMNLNVVDRSVDDRLVVISRFGDASTPSPSFATTLKEGFHFFDMLISLYKVHMYCTGVIHYIQTPM